MNILHPLSNQNDTHIHDPILEGLSLSEDSSIEREFLSNKDPPIIELLSHSFETEINSETRIPTINPEHTSLEPSFGEV